MFQSLKTMPGLKPRHWALRIHLEAAKSAFGHVSHRQETCITADRYLIIYTYLKCVKYLIQLQLKQTTCMFVSFDANNMYLKTLFKLHQYVSRLSSVYCRYSMPSVRDY